MSPERRAVIDVGTNSVKLLVADVDGSLVVPLLEESEQTRLGRGFYDNHTLQPEAIADTARAVAGFADWAREMHANRVRVIATSAARDARNQQELLDAVTRATGLHVEVISGEQEAEWAYRGVRSDALLAGERLLILDVGGGSSEFILGREAHPQFSQSFDLGSVRLLEQIRPSDPPATTQLAACRTQLHEFFTTRIVPVLRPHLNSGSHDTKLVGTGGAATILARMEFRLTSYQRSAIEGPPIARAAVEHWTDRLWSLPLEARRQIVGLPAKRADIILAGAAIYEAVLREFDFPEMRVSTRGLRYAAAADDATRH